VKPQSTPADGGGDNGNQRRRRSSLSKEQWHTEVICSPTIVCLPFTKYSHLFINVSKFDSDSEPEDGSSSDDDPRPAQGQEGQGSEIIQAQAARSKHQAADQETQAQSSESRVIRKSLFHLKAPLGLGPGQGGGQTMLNWYKRPYKAQPPI